MKGAMVCRLIRKIPLVFLIILSACGGSDDDEIEPSVSSVVEAAKFEPIDSPRMFQESLGEVGNAQGFGAAKFEVTFERTTFSDDCKASFLQAEGLTDDISIEEFEQIIDNGYPERSVLVDLYYRDGQLWFLDYGDQDIKGAINEDGTFRIVSGDYPRMQSCHFFVFEGRLDGESMNGTFRYYVHSWDEEPKGSCHMESRFHGMISGPQGFGQYK